jgi:hypothetical protein
VIWIYTVHTGGDNDAVLLSETNKRMTIMRNSKIALAAVMLCTLSFGAFAAAPAPQPGNHDHTPVALPKLPMSKQAPTLRRAHNQPGSQ